VLWDQKVNFRFHESLPLLPILSQINPFYASSSVFKTHFNILLLKIRPSSLEPTKFWGGYTNINRSVSSRHCWFIGWSKNFLAAHEILLLYLGIA